MLDTTELQALLSRLNIGEYGTKAVTCIRRDAPVRRPAPNRASTTVRYASRKMPFILDAEAFETEVAALVTWDSDPTILEIYAQPYSLPITYTGKSGRKVSPTITPDFFLIRETGLAFVECKREEELVRLAAEIPDRFRRCADGRWESPPASVAAARMGFQFLIRSSAENNWTAISNLDFLADYLTVPPAELAVRENALAAIDMALATDGWLSVRDLLDRAPEADADSLYALILQKKVHFSLLKYRLEDPDRALIFRSELHESAYAACVAATAGNPSQPSIVPHSLLPGLKFSWDSKPWEIVNVGESGVHARRSDAAPDAPGLIQFSHAEFVEVVRGSEHFAFDAAPRIPALADAILRRASPGQLKVASDRGRFLMGEQIQGIAPSRRTRLRWWAQFRAAEGKYGIGLVGLIPDGEHKQGQRKSPIDPVAAALCQEVIEAKWKKERIKSKATCYGFLTDWAEQRGIRAVSRKTFYSYVDKHKCQDTTRQRQGEKEAYSSSPPYLELEYTTPRHGKHPFDIGHIDHTPLPLSVIDSTGTWIMKTVWLTVLMSANSRVVLGFYLSFDDPSYRSCMMVVRQCIRNHGRVPRWMIVDGGADFLSTYFELLMTRLGVNVRHRPTGKARFGAVIERLFGITVDQFISNLKGATRDRNPRKVGTDVDPHRHAALNFEALMLHVGRYFDEVYHASEHGALGITPLAQHAEGLRLFGARNHALIANAPDLDWLTLPSTAKGTARVTTQGVKIMYLLYYCSAMAQPGVIGTDLPVRYDPFDRSVAYVYIGGLWQKCRSQYESHFKGVTEKQIRICANRLLLKARNAGSRQTINGKLLARFLQSIEAEELLGMQRLHDAESLPARVDSSVTGTPMPSACDEPHVEVVSPEPELYGDF